MELTIKVECRQDATWKATFEEMPTIFYTGRSESEVRERIEKLAHALRSPHIKIDCVLPNGDAVLTISREEMVKKETVPRRNGLFHQVGMTLRDAVLLFKAVEG